MLLFFVKVFLTSDMVIKKSSSTLLGIDLTWTTFEPGYLYKLSAGCEKAINFLRMNLTQLQTFMVW